MENITPLERKILEDIVRPAVIINREPHFFVEDKNPYYQMASFSETLDFGILLNGVKEFYKKNGGRDWNKVSYENM